MGLVGDRLAGQQTRALVADILQPLRARGTAPTGGDERENDMVTFLDAGDPGSDFGDDSGSLMPSERGIERYRAGTRPQMLVRMAQPGSGEPNLHFAGHWIAQFDLFDFPRLTRRLYYRCLDLHLHSSKFFVMHGRRRTEPE